MKTKKKMIKKYNARGERIYKNPINRENAKKKNTKNKQKQDEKYKTERGCSSHAGR